MHPENPGIAGVTIAQLTAPPTHPQAVAKNTVIVSTGTLDWEKPSSWTHHAGSLALRYGDARAHGGLARERQAAFAAGLRAQRHSGHDLHRTAANWLIAETQVGPYRSVIPTLSGRAWITGFANYVVDAEDPFPNGFMVGDLWGLNES